MGSLSVYAHSGDSCVRGEHTLNTRERSGYLCRYLFIGFIVFLGDFFFLIEQVWL